MIRNFYATSVTFNANAVMAWKRTAGGTFVRLVAHLTTTQNMRMLTVNLFFLNGTSMMRCFEIHNSNHFFVLWHLNSNFSFLWIKEHTHFHKCFTDCDFALVLTLHANMENIWGFFVLNNNHLLFPVRLQSVCLTLSWHPITFFHFACRKKVWVWVFVH